MHETDVPPVLCARLNQRALGHADRSVCGLPGHGRLGEELRPEVLHGDPVVVANHLLRPLARVIPPPVRHLPVQPHRLPLRLPAGHHPLIAGRLLRRGAAMLRMREVVRVTGGRGRFLHAPVTADRPTGAGHGFGPCGDDEGGPPAPHRIAVHAHRGGFGGQLPRPYRPHWQPVLDVLVGRRGTFRSPEWSAAAGRWSRQRATACDCRPGPHLVQLRRTTRALLAGRLVAPLHLLRLHHALVPHPPATVLHSAPSRHRAVDATRTPKVNRARPASSVAAPVVMQQNPSGRTDN